MKDRNIFAESCCEKVVNEIKIIFINVNRGETGENYALGRWSEEQ